jgi:sugar (pentulose or hexulose) kinase
MGIMDLRTKQWRREMLGALESPQLRELAWKQLPRIVDQFELVGALSAPLAVEAGIASHRRPLIFPTSDDQQAGLIGGGAVDSGQVAVILGNSAVVNSSSKGLPVAGELDAMCLSWGPYLWMRCYNNGAQFLDRLVGPRPDWTVLETEARALVPGSSMVLPFVYPEPSLGITAPSLQWFPSEPTSAGARFRTALEGLAYLIARGVTEHESAGQTISRVTVSGGIARSKLVCEILASVLDRPLQVLRSLEGPALGAAVTALAALETHLRRQHGVDTPFTIGDAVAVLVKFGEPVSPNPSWRETYRRGRLRFEELLRQLS